MHFLDFLNESPNFFIFQQKSNQTNFGGVLFLIYIIIMILISLAYILDYALNDKFTYESFKFYNYLENQNELNKDVKLNPFFNLTISIKKFYGYEFAVFDISNYKFIETDDDDFFFYTSNYHLRRQVSDINFFIYFKCGKDENCSSFNELMEKMSQYGNTINELHADVIFDYPSYKISHLEDPPLKIGGDMDGFKEVLSINNQTGLEKITYEWEVIKYKDQQSLFDSLTGNKKEYIGGYVKNDKKPKIEIENKIIDDRYDLGYYLRLFHIKFENNHKEFLYYKREKIEFLDVIANIGALFSTVKYFFSLFFSFYSSNFDNYKIVCKILNYEKEIHQGIELSTSIIESLPSKKKEDENINFNDINNLGPLIDKKSDKKELSAQDSGIVTNIDDDEEDPIVLNKLPFYDFFFNNVYSKCCGKIKNQEVLNTTNEIVYKYVSIDTLLYNQLKLENLFRDYKWNNPSLKSIKNNKLIRKLKNS